jgi:hypothetical protein
MRCAVRWQPVTPMPVEHNLPELMSRVTLRERAAFETVYRATSAHLYGVALRIPRNEGRAEEVLQEAFINIRHDAGGCNASAAALGPAKGRRRAVSGRRGVRNGIGADRAGRLVGDAVLHGAATRREHRESGGASGRQAPMRIRDHGALRQAVVEADVGFAVSPTTPPEISHRSRPCGVACLCCTCSAVRARTCGTADRSVQGAPVAISCTAGKSVRWGAT